ncbi:hypothetical protein DPEC_G00354040 [Dallia pectoralis]|uniref:Uncharacterized protein n=1 Tax=Dallia pectoralis TaxID=75939 RepID=A0ACC2F2I8_DALPE|nr:hypothetical protein DPEC_G00354040 [Dallia pectoralis]
MSVTPTASSYSEYYNELIESDGQLCNNTTQREFGRVFLPTLYSLVFIMGFIGNSLVVCVLVKFRKTSNMTDICLLNLALSDLLFVFSLPFWAYYATVTEWLLGDFLCRTVTGLYMLGFYGSIFFLVIMTLDRYVVIVHAHTMARHRFPVLTLTHLPSNKKITASFTSEYKRLGKMNTTEAVTFNSSTDDYYTYELNGCDMDSSLTSRHIYQPILFYLVFTLGLTGNGLVIWVLLRYMKLKTMTDICLLNLALSDLLLCLSLPLWAYQAQGHVFTGDSPCKIMAGVYQVGLYSGILFVTLMSVDRYLAIVHAVSSFRARTLPYGTLASAVIWLASISASLPEAIFSEADVQSCQKRYPDGTEKTWKLFRNFGENTTSLVLCLPGMSFCYVSILVVLQRTRNSKKERAVRLIFIIVGAYVVSWIPYNIVVFLHTLEMFGIGCTCEYSNALLTATEVTETLALAHCGVNPVIYAFVGEKFRKCLRSVLSRHPLFKRFSKDSTVASRGSEYETSNTNV